MIFIVLTGMCSSTAENHSTGIQRTQSGGGWENKKRRRSRPTNLGLGVAEPGKAKLCTESPGTDVSSMAGWLTGAVSADCGVRPDSEIRSTEWCRLLEGANGAIPDG